jgi:serine/threonine protein kinase
MIVPASRKLGRFEIRQKLGRGGMADVYLAQDTRGRYVVALKLIEYSADSDIRETIEAERRGATLQARLADIDSHVVRIYDCGEIDHYFFVAMEYVPGQDLSELLRAGPLPPKRACAIALEVCETLHHAHSLEVVIGGKPYHGIVHGDIKPKNIRVDGMGRVRVLDFGIAKALSLSRRLTRNEFGSVPYASPERLDSGDVNAHSDLWSLGVMLYEMAAGVQPYQAESTERLERMIRSHVPPPPPPDPCPEDLRRILVKALAPDPAARYATARDFSADLAAFQEDRPAVHAPQHEPEDADPDATRRTFPRDDEDDDQDATRRTVRPSIPAPQRPAASVPAKVFSTSRRVVASLLLLLLGWGMYAVTARYLLWTHGRALDREIAAEHVTDPDQIWQQWAELSKADPSSLQLWGVRGTVRRHLIAAADRTIDTYRMNESQIVYEKDWDHARVWLAHALELDPSDEAVRGKLRLTEGHIARIQGITRKNVPLLNQAVEKFVEAQRLMPKSPDPQLGLARVYVTGLKDIDKAYEALHEAEQRHFKLGNREKGQLADGYRDRADRLWWDSRNVRGLPQEKDQIQRASDDYGRALELYQSIVPWGNASASIVRVQQSLDSVKTRLQQLEGAPVGGNTQ